MSRVSYKNRSVAPDLPAQGSSEVHAFAKDNVVRGIDESAACYPVSGRGWYNHLQNSGFWFAQRQNPGSATTYSSTSSRAITADRWAISNENASVTYQRTDTISAPQTGLSARYYGNFLKITNQGKLMVSQMIGGTESLHIRSRRVRVQCKLKALGGTATTGFVWRMGLIWGTSAQAQGNSTGATFISAHNGAGVDPTLGANLEYVQPLVGQTGDGVVLRPNGVDCTVLDVWGKFGALFDVPANTRNIIFAVWSDDQVRTNNGVAMSEVVVAEGNEPQDWRPLSYDIELHRVQRHYVKTFAVDTAPAQNVGTDTGHLDCIAGKAGATALAAQWTWRLPARMANAGTVTTYNPAAANAEGRNITQGNDLSATAVQAVVSATDVVRITSTGKSAPGATAVGDQCSIHATLDCEFI